MNGPAFSLLVAAGAIALAILLVSGWYVLLRRPRDRQAPHRLGSLLGWRQLNEPAESETIWYGGSFAGHQAAATYVNLRYGSYRRRPALAVEDVILSLRLALAVNVAAPQDVVAYFHHGRPFRPGEEPPDFEYAFDRRNTDRLTPQSRRTLLRFAQQFGSLRLRDRATAPAGLFPETVLANEQVVLVHDRPGHEQEREEIEELLRALLAVAERLEADLGSAGQDSPS